jgi:hypothetical protein
MMHTTDSMPPHHRIDALHYGIDICSIDISCRSHCGINTANGVNATNGVNAANGINTSHRGISTSHCGINTYHGIDTYYRADSSRR